MAAKKKKFKPSGDNGGFVFSTNPDFEFNQDEQEESGSGSYSLEVHVEKKGRNGKQVVIVKGFDGNPLELAQLGKELKLHCGVGGTQKNGEIILQGAVRDKAMDFLKSKGHSVKRVGG